MAQSQAWQRIRRRANGYLPEFALESPDSDLSWYLIVFPKVFLFAAVLLIPFVGAFYISLHQWEPLAASHPFIGLENYVQLLQDPVFWDAVVNTAAYSAALLVFDVPIALGLALLLNMNLRGTKFYSAAIFLPVVTSWVVVSLIWTWLYNPQYGFINAALGMIGLPQLDWLQSSKTALASIAIMSIWKHIGFNMVIFLAGLKGIPDDFYEAAIVDGANRWQRLRHITLPLLKPTTFFVVTVTLIMSFRLYVQVFVMTRGGPARSTYSIVYYFWQTGFQEFQMGYASAIAVVLFIIVFGLSILQQRTWGGDVEY
ncbi:sugar ABC transporter permease [Halogeometricum borinquense]|uniref:Permease component of ABC-type sugar transporter n=2 Tax=Halogeometricum borinquense TaxID=60847 RepID=E4NVH9_HALBP|nr:sugar ABC transporter permease [Halogeometricum borinquense]ADQ68863.1 permease component of ABC-type sugar transporter [Halogeometricum borinquense DSM 11551]ELY28709.1 sugar ABC transporter permease [Halogeometricum borinquense DSM 11551]QIB74473.1 sugar ABC transporter permease [Halogeometricum borinquense]RYJ08423.1 sugar ABC transporter permease [Halogeometricum borinquense]